MPQPAVLDDLQEPLLKSYRRAWAQVQAEQEALVTNPLAYRRKIRLTEMRRTIEAAMDEMDDQAGDWVAKQLPRAYSSGMASAPGASSPTWTQIHQEAVEELSEELFRELLQATDGVRDSTKRLVRTIGRDRALQKTIIGKTAQQASQEMRRVLESKGIHSVVYSNGTKHGLAEYTQVAMRTTTAKAYNRGTLGAHADVGFFEVFDGPSCGWTYHDDTLAAGRVVSRDEASAYPISHPNCRRSFGPRPDVETAEQAKQASPTTTPEQRRAQLEQDAARGDREAQHVLERSDARSARLAARQAKIDARAASVRPELTLTGDEAIVRAWSTTRRSLNEIETKAIRSYAGGGYSRMNKSLRGESNLLAPDKQQILNDRIATMTQLIDEHPLPAKVEVWRGWGDIPDDLFPEGESVGMEFIDQAFMSTSVYRETSEGFSNRGVLPASKFPKDTQVWRWTRCTTLNSTLTVCSNTQTTKARLS